MNIWIPHGGRVSIASGTRLSTVSAGDAPRGVFSRSTVLLNARARERSVIAPGTRLGTAPFGDIAGASGTRLARLLPPVMRFEAWSRAPVSYDCPGSRTCRYRRRDASRDCSLRRYILCLGDASRDCSLRRCASMRVLETERRAAARAREHAAMAAGTRRGTAPSGDNAAALFLSSPSALPRAGAASINWRFMHSVIALYSAEMIGNH